MADFRRWIPVLAVLAIIIGTATTASAATALSCIAGGAVIPELRSEGITELTGDLVYNCIGGTPTAIGQPIPRVNIQVFMNSPLAITSRLIGSGDEALLMIDDPAEADQTLCGDAVHGCALAGLGAGDAAQQASYKAGRYSVFQGVPAALNSVLFTAVPVDPPGTALDANLQPLQRVIRITNIRVNASAFHGAGGVTNLTALTSASPSSTLPINQQGVQQIGIILQGLVVSYTNSPQPGGFSYQQCFRSGVPNDNENTSVQAGTVTFLEGFGTSFKTRTIGDGTEDSPATVVVPQDIPGQFYNTETGFYNPLFPGGLGDAPGGAGLADFGTRLKVTFTNIQVGVTITAPTVIGNGGSGGGTLLLKGTSSENGPYNPVGGFSFTSTSSTNNSFTWVWEVVQADISIESVSVSFTASWDGPPNQPTLGTSQISGWFAPTSNDTVAETEAVAPIPRFQDFSVQPDAFTIQKCQTHLLFPFVTNQNGYDTGVAIANTSTDQYLTTPQEGPCVLYFYGPNAPQFFTTDTITSAGGPFAKTVLELAPNFQGYIIADCDFQYAHGFAFVTRVGGTDIAMGYLALIIPDSPFGGGRAPQSFTLKPGNSGEQLTN